MRGAPLPARFPVLADSAAFPRRCTVAAAPRIGDFYYVACANRGFNGFAHPFTVVSARCVESVQDHMFPRECSAIRATLDPSNVRPGSFSLRITAAPARGDMSVDGNSQHPSLRSNMTPIFLRPHRPASHDGAVRAVTHSDGGLVEMRSLAGTSTVGSSLMVSGSVEEGRVSSADEVPTHYVSGTSLMSTPGQSIVLAVHRRAGAFAQAGKTPDHIAFTEYLFANAGRESLVLRSKRARC